MAVETCRHEAPVGEKKKSPLKTSMGKKDFKGGVRAGSAQASAPHLQGLTLTSGEAGLSVS